MPRPGETERVELSLLSKSREDNEDEYTRPAEVNDLYVEEEEEDSDAEPTAAEEGKGLLRHVEEERVERTRARERLSNGDVFEAKGHSEKWLSHAKAEWRRDGKRQFVTAILFETVPTLFATVLGMVFAGELLTHVSTWPALRKIDELFILIPMLNNMKGNIEMNLSARLSTAANTGQLDDFDTRRSLIRGNLTLLQVQAIAVSAIAAILSFILGHILPRQAPIVEGPAPSGDPARRVKMRVRGVTRPPKRPEGKTQTGFREFAAVLAIGMSSAAFSGLILGSFMCSLVMVCRWYRLNPDNIAPPIASSLGDLITLTLLAFISSVLTSSTLSNLLIPPSSIVIILLVSAFSYALYSTIKNAHVKQLLKEGWVPLFAAMAISSGAGIVLERFVTRWDSFGNLAIVISGLPGAIGSVFVSRISTTLHARGEVAAIQDPTRTAPRPAHSRFASVVSAVDEDRPLLTAFILFIVSLPVLFSFLAFVYSTGWLDLPGIFVGIFCIFFCLTVFISLLIAHFLTNLLWKYKLDPDTYCMPIHSSLVDVVAQLMLVTCYAIVGLLGGDIKVDPTI